MRCAEVGNKLDRPCQLNLALSYLKFHVEVDMFLQEHPTHVEVKELFDCRY